MTYLGLAIGIPAPYSAPPNIAGGCHSIFDNTVEFSTSTLYAVKPIKIYLYLFTYRYISIQFSYPYGTEIAISLHNE